MNDKTRDFAGEEISPETINAAYHGTLMDTLGITFTSLASGRIEATMWVEKHLCQPFGLLHGGATLALAESVAGQGSMILCDTDEVAVGIQVSGNHISPAKEGDKVRAVGTIIHKGRTTHVWNVDLFTSADNLVSSVRVINSILKKK